LHGEVASPAHVTNRLAEPNRYVPHVLARVPRHHMVRHAYTFQKF